MTSGWDDGNIMYKERQNTKVRTNRKRDIDNIVQGQLCSSALVLIMLQCPDTLAGVTWNLCSSCACSASIAVSHVE